MISGIAGWLGLPRDWGECACSRAALGQSRSGGDGCCGGGGCCDGDVRGPRRDGANLGRAVFFQWENELLRPTGGGGGRTRREVSPCFPRLPWLPTPTTPPSVPVSHGPGRKRPPSRLPLVCSSPSPAAPGQSPGPGPLKVGGDGGAERAQGGEGPRPPLARFSLPPLPQRRVPWLALPEPHSSYFSDFVCPSPAAPSSLLCRIATLFS